MEALEGDGGEEGAGCEGGVAEGEEEGVGAGGGGEDAVQVDDCTVGFLEVEG